MARSFVRHLVGIRSVEGNLSLISDAKVTVRHLDGVTVADVFATDVGGSPLTQPLRSSGLGEVEFWVETEDAAVSLLVEADDLTSVAGNGPAAFAAFSDLAPLAGPAGTITDVTVETLDPGEDVEVVVGGTPSARTLLFKIPRGGDGATGPSAVDVDGGQRWAAKRNMRSDSEVWFVASDSTANESLEWVRLLTADQATADTALRVEYYLWDDATTAYAAPVIVQAGTPGGRKIHDTFTGTRADLKGTTPDTVGGVWGGPAGVTGAVSVGSGVASKTATNAGDLVSDGGLAGDQVVTAKNVTMDTTNIAAARQIRVVAKQVNSLNHVYTYVNISNTGVRSWGIFKRIANVATLIASGVAADIPSSTTAVFDMVLSVTGATVAATVNGHTITATLTAGDVLALKPATFAGFGWQDAAGLPKTIDEFYCDVAPTAETSRTLQVYNASQAGATLAYHTTRIVPMLVAAPDIAFISIGHNYGTTDGPTFVTAVETFVGLIRATHPSTGIIVSSQNPQYPPATGAFDHRVRQGAVRAYAQLHRWGYVPVWEAFDQGPGATAVLTDGVHPTTGTGSGSELWRDTVAAYLADLRA